MSKLKTTNGSKNNQKKKHYKKSKDIKQNHRIATSSTSLRRSTRSKRSNATLEQQQQQHQGGTASSTKRQRKASLKLLESLHQENNGVRQKDKKIIHTKRKSQTTKSRQQKHGNCKRKHAGKNNILGASCTATSSSSSSSTSSIASRSVSANASASASKKRPHKQRQTNISSSTTTTTTTTTTTEASDIEQHHKINHHEMVCCICRCSVDYSEREQFDWPSASQQHPTKEQEQKGEQEKEDLIMHNVCHQDMSDHGENKDGREKEIRPSCASVKSEDDDTSQESDFYGVKLPVGAYDPNNALVICDGEGCNRCFHQRCHFVPILSVPRGKWYCLICQYKKTRWKKHPTTSRKSVGGGKNQNKLQNIMQHPVGETWNLFHDLSMEELDQIYRVGPRMLDEDDGASNGNNSVGMTLLEERFEYHSAQMKAELLRKSSQQLVKMIDHYLSSMRLCQNSIRALTEANRRTRNAIIEKYTNTKQLPQELVQNVKRLADCKLKLRQVMNTLQVFIHNKNDRKYLEEWCIEGKKGGFSNANAKIWSTRPRLNDPPVPAVISLESQQEENIERDSFNNDAIQNNNELDIDALEAKLFVGQPVRSEPRFDIKDYDADADSNNNDDFESEDPTNKIKCCMCFSGHVEDNNDVLMCDGEHCFRAFHMKCCAPHVTQRMLDEDENGVWFCPYCVCFAKTIHYIENEYFCHDISGDDSSKSSWDDAEDVFPEALSEQDAAEKWREGKCNDNSEKVFGEMLGIEIEKEMKNDKVEQVDEDDESDTTFVSKEMSEPSISSSGSNSDECLEFDWKVDKSELSALSGSEDELSINKESERKETTGRVRKSKRLKRQNFLDGEKSDRSVDVGALDKSNIVYGKRNRSKVDYNRLNDVMFGKVAASSIDDEEEYQLATENLEDDSCCSRADTSHSE